MKTIRLISLVLALILSFSLILVSCGKKNDEPDHECIYEDEWTIDENYHYKKCTVEGCTKEPYKYEHVYDKALDNSETLKTEANCVHGAEYFYSCVCGYCDKTKAPTHFGDILGEHNPSPNFVMSETQHWHRCLNEGCNEKIGLENHCYNDIGNCECGHHIWTDLVCVPAEVTEIDTPELDTSSCVIYRISMDGYGTFVNVDTNDSTFKVFLYSSSAELFEDEITNSDMNSGTCHAEACTSGDDVYVVVRHAGSGKYSCKLTIDIAGG